MSSHRVAVDFRRLTEKQVIFTDDKFERFLSACLSKRRQCELEGGTKNQTVNKLYYIVSQSANKNRFYHQIRASGAIKYSTCDNM